MSSNAGPDIVQDGLVLCLDAGDRKSYPGSGTTWTDRSGNGNNGTLTNGPIFNSEGHISFDGAGDYVECPVIDNTSDLTVMVWFRFTADTFPTYTAIISKDHSTRVWQLNLKNGRPQSHLNSGMTADSQIEKNTWYHICLTSETGVGGKLYINGVHVKSSGTAIPADTSSTPVRLKTFNGLNTTGEGDISQALVYNKTLTAKEVLQNYQATRSRFS